MAQISTNVVKVKCKKCGRDAPADEFKLDYEYKTVVCARCYARKPSVKPVVTTENGFVHVNKVSNDEEVIDKMKKDIPFLRREKSKPVEEKGDFVELEMISKPEPEKFSAIEEGPTESVLKIACPDCNFKFKYNRTTGTPRNCPYCGEQVRM